MIVDGSSAETINSKETEDIASNIHFLSSASVTKLNLSPFLGVELENRGKKCQLKRKKL